MKERERSPYLRTDKIVYENPPSLTNFRDNDNEISKPIHINMHSNPLPIKMLFFLYKLLKSNFNFFIRKSEKKLAIDELEKAFSTNYSSKIDSILIIFMQFIILFF